MLSIFSKQKKMILMILKILEFRITLEKQRPVMFQE